MVATGEVNFRGELTFVVSIRDRRGELHEVPALIDTGFTGSLTLPDVLIDALSSTEVGNQVVTLGDGSDEFLRRYAATLHWLGENIVVDALAADGLPLIGLGLLHGCYVTHHAIDGGAVMLYRP